MKINKIEMIKFIALGGILMTMGAAALQAQTAPFAATNWPPTVSSKATVHYFIADPKAAFTTHAGWNQSLSFAEDGDQAYDTVSHDGLSGLHSTDVFMNIADAKYTAWTNTPVIDVLLQVYGDGTLYTNDEMIAQGLLNKTGDRMGHMNMSGRSGSVETLGPLNIGRKIFIHINNSNPILLDDSIERAGVVKEGWEVAYDGMEVSP